MQLVTLYKLYSNKSINSFHYFLFLGVFFYFLFAFQNTAMCAPFFFPPVQRNSELSFVHLAKRKKEMLLCLVLLISTAPKASLNRRCSQETVLLSLISDAKDCCRTLRKTVTWLLVFHRSPVQFATL